MTWDHNGYKVVTSFRTKFTLFISILTLCVVSTFWVLKNAEDKRIYDSIIINIAGKQRALTEKIARLLESPYSIESNQELDNTINELLLNQQYLNKNHESALSAVYEDIYGQDSPNLNDIIVTNANNAIASFNISRDKAAIKKLLIAFDEMFVRLDNEVEKLTQRSSLESERSTALLYTLMAIVFTIAVLIVFFIYRPINKTLIEYAIDTSRLQAIVRSVTECIKSIDRDCRIIDMNSAGLGLINANCLEQIKGQSVLELVDPAYHTQFKEGVIRVFNGETVDQEFEITGLDGTKRWMHQVAVPYRDPATGEVTEMIAVTRDISKKKEHAETIARIRRSELISNLSAGVAHDFNNILGIITGNREIMALRNSQPELQKYILNIEAAVDRASSLTQKLLKSSKDSPSKVELVTVKELHADLQPMFEEAIPNNITVNWEVDQSLYERVNKYELEDVLLNLVLNAKNAIEHHGTIDIRINKKDELLVDKEYFSLRPKKSETYITIEVEDNGIGIENDKLEEIFLPFKTYSNSGTGLGLSMVYGFAGRYDYGLSIRSTVNEGSCFTIWIPNENTPLDMPTNEQLVHNGEINRPLNIVLIDDEPELLATTRQLLESRGHQVHAFLSASDALHYINKNTNTLDVIITDEVMPGELQGHDIIEKLHGRIPIVLVTGYSESKHFVGTEDLILNKPFTLDTLIAKINVVMGNLNNKS